MRVVAAPPRPIVGEARLRLTFATGELPVDARFEAFRDNYARRLFQMDMVCRTERPYAAAIDLRVTTPAIFGLIKGDEAEVFRARAGGCAVRGGRLGPDESRRRTAREPG